MSKKLYTLNDITRLKKLFTKEDLALAKWLQTGPPELIEILVSILIKQFTNSVLTDCFFEDHLLKENLSSFKPRHQIYLSVLLVYELKRYSAHSFHFLSAKPGYDVILSRVLKSVAKKHGEHFKNLNQTIKEKETLLADLIFAQGAEPSASEKSNFINISAGLFLKATIKKVTPRLFKRLTPAIGWLLFAKDIYDFGAEATRVTIPFVVNIAVYRSAKAAKK